jgi:polysaccharide export outer membrane protein
MLESKLLRFWFDAALLVAAVSCGQALNAQEKPEPASPGEYRIVAGDVIQIDVWQEPDISRTIQVNPDGNIRLPFIDDIKASGLSAMQLAGLIRHKLEGKLANPRVTVAVRVTHNGTILAPGSSVPVIHPRPLLSPELRQKCCVA